MPHKRSELLRAAGRPDHNSSPAFLMSHSAPGVREPFWHAVCIPPGTSLLLLSGFLVIYRIGKVMALHNIQTIPVLSGKPRQSKLSLFEDVEPV